LPPFTA